MIKTENRSKSQGLLQSPVHSPVALVELTIRWIRINATLPPIHLNTI